MGRNAARNHGLDALVPPHKQSAFANSFMELVSRGESLDTVAEKLGRGYLGPQRRLSVGQMQSMIEMIVLHGRGDQAFRTWYPLQQSGRPESAKVIAIADATRRNPLPLEERVQHLERERDALVQQLKAQAARHEGELRAAKETAAQDAIREAVAERNEALRAKADAEFAQASAQDRAEKAEQELLTMSRRPHADAAAMDAAQETIRSLRGTITKLELKLATATKERDEKDVALRGALARLNNQRVPEPKVSAIHRSSKDGDGGGVMEHLSALVDAGVMTDAEAFSRLRDTRR